MEKLEISQIIAKTEVAIGELDDALDFENDHLLNAAALTLGMLIEDIRKFASEESALVEIENRKLFETIDTAWTVLAEIRIAIDEGDYRLTSAASFLLRFVLDDIRELVNGEKSERWIPPRR